MKKKIKEISDGYHTFDELYEHRNRLFIALCRAEFLYCTYADVWRSLYHSDGTDYSDYFILGIGTEKGKQITYHLPLKYWKDTNFAKTLDKAPTWDKHTSKDVLKRLKDFSYDEITPKI